MDKDYALLRPSQLAFVNAIREGVFKLNAASKLHVGNYLYFYSEFDSHTDAYVDTFKHVDTGELRHVFNRTAPHIDCLRCSPDDPDGLELAKEELKQLSRE